MDPPAFYFRDPTVQNPAMKILETAVRQKKRGSTYTQSIGQNTDFFTENVISTYTRRRLVHHYIR